MALSSGSFLSDVEETLQNPGINYIFDKSTTKPSGSKNSIIHAARVHTLIGQPKSLVCEQRDSTSRYGYSSYCSTLLSKQDL